MSNNFYNCALIKYLLFTNYGKRRKNEKKIEKNG